MKIYYNPNLTELARELRNNMTNAEKSVWRMLKGKQLMGYDFHRQKPIGNFIADFYCHDLKLVIEIDGISHTDEKVKANDKRKEEYFNLIGLKVLRFTDEEVFGNWDIVESKIKAYITTHPLTPSF
jgi:very-short-patch-repair endonuclease